MSRVDESRSEQRAEEARLAERREKDLQQKKRTEVSTAFDRALAGKAAEKARPFVSTKPTERAPEKPAEPAHEPEIGGQAHEAAAAQHDSPEAAARRARLPKPPMSFGERMQEKRLQPQATPEQVLHGKAKSSDEKSQSLQSRVKDMVSQTETKAEARSDALSSAGRRESQASADRAFESRGEDMGKSGLSAATDKRRAVGRADDGGGSGGKDSKGGGGDKDSKSTFRLPPTALMAPPPLARPRDAQAARFRAITQEIVDKIVSRVLVGSNEKGIPEFRLELKSSVLKGLSIKVSGGRGGKIRAVFSGSDREVLAALKQSSGELAKLLESRGLTLEELVIEEAGG